MQLASKDGNLIIEGDIMHKICMNPECGAPKELIPNYCPRTDDSIYQYRIIYKDTHFNNPDSWRHFNLYSHICFSSKEINQIIKNAFDDIKLYSESWNGPMCNQIWYSIKDYILETDSRFIPIKEYKRQVKFEINEEDRTIKSA